MVMMTLSLNPSAHAHTQDLRRNLRRNLFQIHRWVVLVLLVYMVAPGGIRHPLMLILTMTLDRPIQIRTDQLQITLDCE